jgi:hypothetical protein
MQLTVAVRVGTSAVVLLRLHVRCMESQKETSPLTVHNSVHVTAW